MSITAFSRFFSQLHSISYHKTILPYQQNHRNRNLLPGEDQVYHLGSYRKIKDFFPELSIIYFCYPPWPMKREWRIMGFVCIYFFCNFTYKPVKIVQDRLIFSQAKQTNHCNEIRIMLGFFLLVCPYHFIACNMMLHYLPEWWVDYFKNYYKHVWVIRLSAMTQALSEKQKKVRVQQTQLPFLIFIPKIYGVLNEQGMEAIGLDKQKLQIIQERVWPFSPKFLDAGSKNTETSEIERLWIDWTINTYFLFHESWYSWQSMKIKKLQIE